MNQSYGVNRSTQSVAEENARFMAGVYKWMTIGILITAIVAYYVGHTPALYTAILQSKIIFYGLMIAQVGAVIYLSARVNKMSGTQATVIFLLYSLLSGLTLSIIFLVYAQSTIEAAFLTTAFAFGGLSAFGYITKKDLGPIGTFCTMGLWGLIAFSIIGMFFPSMFGGQMGMVYNLAGLVIFCGLTAYDTQKIKNSNVIGQWTAPVDWNVVGLHSILLPDETVMTFGSYAIDKKESGKDIRSNKKITVTDGRELDRDGGDHQWKHHEIFTAMDFDIWDPKKGVGEDSHILFKQPVVMDAFCSVVRVLDNKPKDVINKLISCIQNLKVISCDSLKAQAIIDNGVINFNSLEKPESSYFDPKNNKLTLTRPISKTYVKILKPLFAFLNNYL